MLTVNRTTHTHYTAYTAFILLLTCLISSSAMAQRKSFGHQNLQSHDDKRYHFGFSLGVNQMSFALKPNFEDPEFNYTLPEPDFGFHIGIVSNLKLASLWDLRFVPTLSFGDRYIYYHETKDWITPPSTDNQGVFDPTLLEFPLHLKFKSVRMVNTRVYVIGGLKYSYDLASIELGVDDDILVRVARNDFHYEMGVGFDYYFYYFKFSAELKASFGMANLARKGEIDRYFSSIDRLNSQSIMISFLFE